MRSGRVAAVLVWSSACALGPLQFPERRPEYVRCGSTMCVTGVRSRESNNLFTFDPAAPKIVTIVRVVTKE